jgi:hypothetical protein
VESGDLFDYIVLNGRLPEEEARHFFQQVWTYCFYAWNCQVIGSLKCTG